jgi:hypothetical protein
LLRKYFCLFSFLAFLPAAHAAWGHFACLQFLRVSSELSFHESPRGQPLHAAGLFGKASNVESGSTYRRSIQVIEARSESTVDGGIPLFTVTTRKPTVTTANHIHGDDPNEWARQNENYVRWSTARMKFVKGWDTETLIALGKKYADQATHITVEGPQEQRLAAIRIIRAPFGVVRKYKIENGEKKLIATHRGNFGPTVIRETMTPFQQATFLKFLKAQQQAGHEVPNPILNNRKIDEDTAMYPQYWSPEIEATNFDLVSASHDDAIDAVNRGEPNNMLDLPLDDYFKDAFLSSHGQHFADRKDMVYLIRSDPADPTIIYEFSAGLAIEGGNYALDKAAIEKINDRELSYERVQDLLFYYFVMEFLDSNYRMSFLLTTPQIMTYGNRRERKHYGPWGFHPTDEDAGLVFQTQPASLLVCGIPELRRFFWSPYEDPYKNRTRFALGLQAYLQHLMTKSGENIPLPDFFDPNLRPPWIEAGPFRRLDSP